jgi:hypothetical protein
MEIEINLERDLFRSKVEVADAICIGEGIDAKIPDLLEGE